MKDEMFDELRFEILLNEMPFDENEADMENFLNNLDKYGTIPIIKIWSIKKQL